MLDIVFFGIVKQTKNQLWKDASLHYMADHTRRMFRAFEAAGASSNVPSCFQHAGFTDVKDQNGMYTLGFNEKKVRSSPAFKEAWDIHFPIEGLSARRQTSRWGFLNPERLSN
jgi:hypothetical protein